MKGDNVVCFIKNSATLAGTLFTLHASQIHIEMPTLSDKDKEVIFLKLHILLTNVMCYQASLLVLHFKFVT